MYVVNVDDVEKRVLGSHGETAKYQLIFGRGSDHPITKSITSVWVMTVEPGEQTNLTSTRMKSRST